MINKDCRGNIFSIEILISLFFIILLITTISSLNNDINEKIITQSEMYYLEKISNELCDTLIKNSKSITNQNINTPGIAIENNEKVILNTISYEKLLNLKDNYNDSIKNKVFNNQIDSSMTLIPMNNEISSIKLGENNENGSNVIKINRTVKCDFYSKYVILDYSLSEYLKYCNHDNIQEVASHNND